MISTQVKYEVDLDLANRDGKKLPEGSRVEYRKEAYDPLTAVEGVIVKVDEKKECKACGRQFLTPFPDICPDCYVECKRCPSEERCGWTCKPCIGVLKTGEPCTRDENCDKCKGKYGCGRVYGPGTEPAPFVYSGPNPPKTERDKELKKLDGQILCTDPRCTALRKVKKGKKFVDRPNETPLTACDGCGGKYGCGAKYNAQTCPKPTDKDGNIDEEKGSMKCISPACRKLRFCRPARTGRNPRPEQKPNDSALYKNTLRSLTKMECPNCHARHSPPYPEGRTAEGKKGLVCDKCGTKQKLKELTDVEAGLPKYLYTIAHGGEEAINVVKGQLTAKSHRCIVPGKMVRAASCKDKEGCLTRGGFDNRFTAGDKVTATRPALSMDEALEVGMRVKVLEGPYAGASGVVHKLIVDKDDDVEVVDASKSRAPRDAAAALRVARFGGGGATPTTTETKASTVKYEVKVRPKRGAEVKVTFERSALEDQKDGLWRPAKVVSVVKPAGCADAFEQTLGSIRLDDSSPDRRGQLLETFRSDPETSVLLLTLQTAGVGLNITNANKVIILEPFRFGAQEAQAVTRVHRIGQLRPVEIIKFYCRNTVDERMLRLRQKRGELDASQDGDAPSADDVGAGAGDTAFAKADLDVLFGVTE